MQNLIHEIQRRRKGQKREKQRQKWLNAKLENLTDPTLLDRMSFHEGRPIEPDPRPEKPIFNPRPRSIDGILAGAR